jgi:uncharacterized protein
MTPDAFAEPSDLEPTVLDTEPAPGSAVDPVAGLYAASVAWEAPQPTVEALPVSSAERYFAVDVLRGFALLGILAMNIVSFGWPWPAYGNPMRGGGFTGLNRGVWFFNHLIFEEKMMTIFSMLFGAGLVLMDQRAEARGAKIGRVYYRRVLLLLLIGLIHSYLIWIGDILVLYAQCGLLLYFFRNLRPRTLLIVGVLALCVQIPVILGFGMVADYLKAASQKVEAQKKAGQTPSADDLRLHEAWQNGMRHKFAPTPEEELKSWNDELKAYRGGYRGIVRFRAGQLVFIQTFAVIFFALYMAIGRMLIGMGLMKLGVFSGDRSRQFYAWMVAIGYGAGMPLMIYDAGELIRHRFSTNYQLHGGEFLNGFGSIIVAMGHVGLIMLIVQSGAIQWLTRRLAAVGRMALSNYLTHSIVCTTLFYGYGFGLFGTINRTGLAAIVLIIWASQLWLSPIWLAHFRFGPAEWLWRSLTYGQPQRMRLDGLDKPAEALPAG